MGKAIAARIQCPNRELQAHNETMVTRCYKQSNLLTRKYLGSTLTLKKISNGGCFTEVIRGHKLGVVEPDVMRGLKPAGATRVTLDVIVSHRPGKVEADRDAVPAGLPFQLQCSAADKGPTPIYGPIKKANEPPPYVLSLGNQP